MVTRYAPAIQIVRPRINRRDAAPTPSGVAEIVGDNSREHFDEPILSARVPESNPEIAL